MEVPGIEFNPAYKGQGIKTVLENLRRLKWVSKGIGWENEFEVNLEEEFLVSRIFGIEINDVASVWPKGNQGFEMKFVDFLVSSFKFDRMKKENIYKYIVDDSIAPENSFLFSYVQAFVGSNTSSLDIVKSLFFSKAFSTAYYWATNKNLIEKTKKILKLKIVDMKKDLNGRQSEACYDLELKTGGRRNDNLILIGKNRKSLLELELFKDNANNEEIFAIASLKSNGIYLLDISDSYLMSVKRNFYVSLYQGINLLIGPRKSLEVTEMQCYSNQVLEFNLINFNVTKSYKVIALSEPFNNEDTPNIYFDQTSEHQTQIYTYNESLIISNENYHIPLIGPEEISLLIYFHGESKSWILQNNDNSKSFWQIVKNSKSFNDESENHPVNIGFGPSEILISDVKLELNVEDCNN